MRRYLLIIPLFFSLTSYSQFDGGLLGFYSATVYSGALKVTDRYIANAALNDAQGVAVKKYVKSLDSVGLYNKIIAEWIPLDTAKAKWNLVDPENDSSAFYLNYIGARPSAVAEGLQYNGGYFNTYIDFTTVSAFPLAGAGFYSPVAIASGFWSTTDNTMNLLHHDGSKVWIFMASSSAGRSASYSGGLLDMQRESIDSTHSYLDGSLFTSEGNAVSTFISQNKLLGNYYAGAAVATANKKSILFVHLAFTSTEQALFNTFTQQLLTDLGLL